MHIADAKIWGGQEAARRERSRIISSGDQRNLEPRGTSSGSLGGFDVYAGKLPNHPYLRLEEDSARFLNSASDFKNQFENIGGGCLPGVDDEIGVPLGNRRSSDGEPLATGFFDQSTG